VLKLLVVRFLKAKWGSILPTVFKAAAEGQFGPRVKFLYWWTAQYKTFVGAVLWGAGAALETVCANYPQFAWSCTYALYPYYVGMFLTGVGLADGGTRAPWPDGAQAEHKEN
jgi:hypothetical protein